MGDNADNSDSSRPDEATEWVVDRIDESAATATAGGRRRVWRHVRLAAALLALVVGALSIAVAAGPLSRVQHSNLTLLGTNGSGPVPAVSPLTPDGTETRAVTVLVAVPDRTATVTGVPQTERPNPATAILCASLGGVLIGLAMPVAARRLRRRTT